jgi:thioredoxin reductase
MRYDAIVVGGSFAGLSGALYIARARRSVLVVDAGRPRNRFAAHSHGVIAQDGRPPAEILESARAQLAMYPSVTMQTGEVTAVNPVADGFDILLADGARAVGRRVLLSTGITDILPEIPGLAERWGKSVFHCPYCHGFEIGGGNIGVIANGPLSVHAASLIADWGDVTFFTNDSVDLDEAARVLLRARKVAIVEGPVAEVVGPSTETEGVRLRDGRAVPVHALFVGPSFRMTSPLAQALGCAFDETPVGAIVSTDMFKHTTVPGVYAAGDSARMQQSITFASADGIAAGVGIHQSLIAEEVASAA